MRKRCYILGVQKELIDEAEFEMLLQWFTVSAPDLHDSATVAQVVEWTKAVMAPSSQRLLKLKPIKKDSV